jgi:alpha-L-fucosidase
LKSRREFLQLAGKTATVAAALHEGLAASQPALRPAPSTAMRRADLLTLQQQFVDLRFGMFLHFNMATFQDREWGDPTSPPDLFNPTALDTDQWAAAAKSAKMTWACLTTRHHDGFCIWPTKTRGNSVAQTTHKTDIVRAYVDSFRRAGLRVGLYYSILSLRDDIRHFNVTPAKIQLIKDELSELFTNYGPVDILVTDGWDAPWSRITYEEVPFREIYDHIKSFQPECLICDLNAASYPAGGLYYSDVKAFEQNAGQRVPAASDLPALSCVTITDGWFWKQDDLHGKLKPAETVVNEWLVPLNRRHCNLILNAPPTREGRLAPNVVERLAEIGELWKREEPASRLAEHPIITTPNLATGKPIHASSSPDTVGPDLANDGNFRSAWSPDEGDHQPWLEIDLETERRISVVSLIQQVPKDAAPAAIGTITFEFWKASAWTRMATVQDPNPTCIQAIPATVARRVRVRIDRAAGTPSVADIGLYDEP